MNKDFYVDSHFICAVKSPDNIFDLPDTIFNCCDFLCFENAVKDYVKSYSVKMHLWPWGWHDSSLTNEVYIYEMNKDRILYYAIGMEFFDARMVRKQQSLEGCEVFDFTFKFPLMLDISVFKKRKEYETVYSRELS